MIDILNEYVDHLKEIEGNYPYAEYDWYVLPGNIPHEWWAFSQMVKEHSMELANSINELLRYIYSLTAWEKVIKNKSESEKHRIVLNFINPVATIALNLPYVIRSRFVYSIAHLCHQANKHKQKNWKDDLALDSEIYFGDADKHGKHWEKYKKLKRSLDKISNKKYQTDTNDFRNKYNHRYSPMIEIGLTNLVTRKVGKNGRVSYSFGFTNPLTLVYILPIMTDQFEKCLISHKNYQELVNKQIEEIKPVIRIDTT
jgi:hypothetical protein